MAAIADKFVALAEDPTIGHFDLLPRPIYRFRVDGKHGDDSVQLWMQVAYRVLEDEGLVLVSDVGPIPF